MAYSLEEASIDELLMYLNYYMESNIYNDPNDKYSIEEINDELWNRGIDGKKTIYAKYRYEMKIN